MSIQVKLVEMIGSLLESSNNILQEKNIQNGFLIRPFGDMMIQNLWLEKVKNDKSSKHYAIILDNVHIGNCGLKNIDLRHGISELFIYISQNYSGKGYASHALKQLKSYAFNELNLRKINLRVRTDNISATILYLKNGFKFEGLLLDEFVWEDKMINLYRMVCFKHLHEEDL